MSATVRVFCRTQLVMGRAATYPVPPRFKVEIVSRETQEVLYTSKTCDSKNEAFRLAARYLARHPNMRDTLTVFPKMTNKTLEDEIGIAESEGKS